VELRRLGRSGLQVSAIGLGCSTLGEVAFGIDAVALVHRALDLGITFLDTAITYSGGYSEEILGEALVGRRHGVVLATKLGLQPPGGNPLRRGLSRRWIMQAIEVSLERLRTDYVDLYQAHRPDPDTPLEETLRAMDDLVAQGKVRYVGGSNYPAWEMAHAAHLSSQHGLAPWVSAQNRWNLLDGLDDPHLLPASRALGFGLVPYMPLAAGILTGKYAAPTDTRPGTRLGDLERFRYELTDARIAGVKRLQPWAEARGHTTADLGLAWLLAYPEVATVIASARTPAQIEQNVRAAEWRLTPEERDEARALASGE
jgi:aryl-alcohol dehydrogenase-like predicted oxidoreductase